MQKPSGLNLPAIRPIKAQDVVEPLQALFADPTGGWELLRSNNDTFQRLFERYVFCLAAIPAISGYIGFCVFGSGSMLSGLAVAGAAYLLSLAFVYGAVILAQRTVRIFDGQMSTDESARLIIYSLLPFFLCGIFLLLPPLKYVTILGVSSLYLFYRGLQPMTGIPAQKVHTYFLLNVVAWILFVDFCAELLWR